MSIEVVVYVVTALAAVVVVLTRVRLGGEGGAGRIEVGTTLLNVHSVAGLLALILWVAYLVAGGASPLGGEVMGIVALALWWVTALAGLLVLVRWLPTRGKHATQAREDSWPSGPWLSLLAHLGLLGGVLVLTYAYAGTHV